MKVQPMDLKSFSENDFDPKKWINKAWTSSGDQEKEAFVTNAVGRLQLYLTQLSYSIEETTTQIMSSLPKILDDATELNKEALEVQHDLQNLDRLVQGVEEQTGNSIESLQKIDNLKSKLEISVQAFREADKWAALTSSMENRLDNCEVTQENLQEFSTQMSALAQSLELTSEGPDHDAKRQQLEILRNRLEAATNSILVDTLTRMDPEYTKVFVSLYRAMSRSSSLRRIWKHVTADRLAVAWSRLDEHSMPGLHQLLASDAASQIDWLINVLKSETPLADLVRLYTDLLSTLEPSPVKMMSANLKLCANAKDGITLLTHLRKDVDGIVFSIRGTLDASKTDQASSRYLKMPASVLSEPISAQHDHEFGKAAYAPLRELLPQYTELLTQILLQRIDKMELGKGDLVENSRSILKVVEQMESWLCDEFNKAMNIGGVAAYTYYVPAVENVVTVLSSRISSQSREIESDFLSAVTANRPTGVLSDSFAASLVLETATTALIDAVLRRHDAEVEEPLPQSPHPLQDLPSLLLDEDGRRRLSSYRSEPPLSVGALRRAKEHLTTLARNILKQPVEAQLDKIPELSVWSNNDALTTDLPDFALSPQEYITEVGQYLMTLPQHLEMHLSERQAPWQLLSEVCVHTCEIYADKILKIKNMDELGTKRCLTDIVYISSVVEDLGSSITPALKSLEKSLRAATPQAQPSNH